MDHGADEADAEALELLDGLEAARSAGVHGADGQRDGGRRGKHELELAGDLDDEELAERGHVKQADEGADERDGEDGSDVVPGRVALSHDAEAVHGRDRSDEDAASAASARRSGLDDGVLLGPEHAADEGEIAARFLEEPEDAVSEDGAEHVGAKREARLQTCHGG